MKLSKLNVDGSIEETKVIKGNFIIELDNGEKYFISDKNIHKIKIDIKK